MTTPDTSTSTSGAANDGPISSPSPTTPGDDAQRAALTDSERKASEAQPGSFKDDAMTDKVVSIPPSKVDAPIKGLDPKSK